MVLTGSACKELYLEITLLEPESGAGKYSLQKMDKYSDIRRISWQMILALFEALFVVLLTGFLGTLKRPMDTRVEVLQAAA
jgi:hypothetical protein